MAFRKILSLFLLLFSHSVFAEYVLSAPPREDASQAQKLYGPLAAELTRITGERVSFSAPSSWAAYSRAIQAGEYDFVLDGPHFVAWRMVHAGHVPLVSINGKLGYTVFTAQQGPASMDELRLKKVCSMASPNLAAVALLAQFDAHVAPFLVSPRGGVKGSMAAFEEGQCVAVVLPNYVSEHLPQEKVAGLKRIFTSADMPNITLTAAPRVPAQLQQKLVAALQDPATQATLKGLLDNLAASNSGAFVTANPDEFRGHEKLLEGVVWGW